MDRRSFVKLIPVTAIASTTVVSAGLAGCTEQAPQDEATPKTPENKASPKSVSRQPGGFGIQF